MLALRGWGLTRGYSIPSSHELYSPFTANRLADQAQMRQVPESCPMHPNWHGQLLTLCADGRYRWRWTCCGRDV